MATQPTEPDAPAPPTAAVDDEWAHRLGHLLWEVSSHAALLAAAELADTPLTSRSLGSLDRIAAAPGITVAGIARHSPSTQQAVSQVVARLEKLGYVERRLGAGRGVGLYLTAAGTAQRQLGQQRERAAEALLRERLGDELFDDLRALLERTRDRLGELPARPAHSKENHI